ncbi:MAG: SDR family oxidoreductase [Ghiorsea sp.]
MKQSSSVKSLLILGCGYVGTKLAQTCLAQGIKVKATVRNPARVSSLLAMGIDAVSNGVPSDLNPDWLSDCDTLVDSIPLSYDEHKQPFQTQSLWAKQLTHCMPSLKWVGYLSATSVYADSQGEWINESNTNYSPNPRGMERRVAEQAWLNNFVNTEIFRLAGIYGDERNIIDKLQAGDYKTVKWQPEHFSNRIHVDDIIATLLAAMHTPKSGRLLNIADDEPCSHHKYATALAASISAPTPIVLTPEQAKEQMSAAYLSFFRDNKRISNKKLHHELLPKLKYPSFRDAIPSLTKSGVLPHE